MRKLLPYLGILLTILCTLAAFSLKHDDNMRRVFKSSSSSYAALERLYDSFVLDDSDFVILINSSDSILRVSTLRAISELVFQLRERNDIHSVFSLLDARSVQGSAGYHAPLVPDLDETERLSAEQINALRTHPLLSGVLLSDDASTALIIATAKNSSKKVSAFAQVYEEIQLLVDTLRADYSKELQGVQIIVGGLPAMQVESLESSKRDQLLFTFVGGALGACIAWSLIRQIRPFLVVFLPPLAGAMWMLGFLVLSGEQFNALNTVLPILIIIVGFTDSLHLLLAGIDRLRDGQSVTMAINSAYKDLVPACTLTSITTAIAFGSLLYTDSEIVQRFGVAGAVGILLNLFSVLLFVRFLFERLLREESSWNKVPAWNSNTTKLSRFTRFLGERTQTYAKRITVFFLLLLSLAIYGSLQLRPDHRYHENLPTGNAAHQLISISEEKFGGSSPVRALIEWTRSDVDSNQTLLSLLAEVESLFAEQPKFSTPFSLRTALALTTADGDQPLTQLLDKIPPTVAERLINLDARAAVVSAQVEDMSTVERIKTFKLLQEQFDTLKQTYPQFTISLTGLHVISTEQSFSIISDLAKSLGLASVLIFAVMTFAFRSITLGLISLLPNLFPLITTAALLHAFGLPLQYSSVIVFTVALGVAVDDTIHYLLRFKSNIRLHTNTSNAIRDTSQQVGFVISITTVILVAGMSSIYFSQVPTLSLFGVLSCVSLTLALVGDLLLLPALLTVCMPLLPKNGKTN